MAADQTPVVGVLAVQGDFAEREQASWRRVEFNGSYNSVINDLLDGFYRSKYEDPTTGEEKVLAATQFEKTHARRAFPCMDEPGLKANFDISIGAKEPYMVVGNTPVLEKVSTRSF